jgi:phosphoribosyl 1,2-cyclic phosphodiesterase
VRVWSLGSGSSGNALVVESDGHRVLVDCGFGPRALATRLKAVGIAPESISALLVTHEHVDHAQGVERAQKKWRWPVHATSGTLRGLRDIEARWRRPVETGREEAIDGFRIEAVAVPHDAASPVAFVITAVASGARVGIAHDLGAIPGGLPERLARCDILCLEANHDAQMLRDGPYPAALKTRIRGGRGHLSNDEGGALAADLTHGGLRRVVLLHLSAVNNTPEVAVREVGRHLRAAGYTGPLVAAPRRDPMEVASLSGSHAASTRSLLPAPRPAPVAAGRSQLDLGL